MAHLRRPASALLLALAIVPLTVRSSSASPLPPSVSASQSANKQWLVVRNEGICPADSCSAQGALRTTYRVLNREPFLNGKDRLDASVPFWSEVWTVSLSGVGSGQSWPLRSDDGKSLVLVSVVIPAPDASVLAIYRERAAHGELVRAIKLSDLWTPRQIDPKGDGIVMDKGYTPQWFAGGHFAFSADASTLIYRDQWSSTKFINLRDGTITSRPNLQHRRPVIRSRRQRHTR